jgi:uncharacterized protein YciW
MSDLAQSTALAAAGIAPDGPLADAIAARAKVLEMTQAAEDAVLAPRDTGGFSHDVRAALAARLARLNGDGALADRYAARISGDATLADPGESGTAQGLAPVVAFMDKVAARTREVAAEDIAALQAAGISDADIVRLAELNAFMAYQIRLVAGLRLMGVGG